jgi:hypothetical protein
VSEPWFVGLLTLAATREIAVGLLVLAATGKIVVGLLVLAATSINFHPLAHARSYEGRRNRGVKPLLQFKASACSYSPLPLSESACSHSPLRGPR